MSDPQLQRSHVSRHAIKLAVTNRCMQFQNLEIGSSTSSTERKLFYQGQTGLVLVLRSGRDVKLIWRDYAGKRQEHAELKESHRCKHNFYALLSSAFLFFCGCIIGIAIWAQQAFCQHQHRSAF